MAAEKRLRFVQKKTSMLIQVLSGEMKGYLTNSKVVFSPELKMAKVSPLSTSSSIWSELGSEKWFVKEHTWHGGIERSEEITWEHGRRNKVRLFFKMQSALW